ncbi:3-phosphoshikimate 1-carboxyvinyltransferase [Veillonella sp. CHU110]|uniref:3-phosphoshikimate 1-carboxyvinyltransferase n=1 Tax=Veillonella sp. CHU110 TaxID=2490947 RepID=UPI000F8CE335|nr:3-phosphoshikimate 1-carboxyvinyltransferase [Veillonella sp. CHU110]
MQHVSNVLLRGTIPSIPAKAHAHRALIAASLATSPSTILISHSSKDIDATMDSLRSLGATITYENGVAHVTPGSVPTMGHVLPHESGTTLRLLLPVSTSICDTVEVDAKGRLPERPLEPLLSEMKSHGVSFSQEAPPFTMTGRLQGGTFSMTGSVSSQFFSGLLLAAPQLEHTTVNCTSSLQSKDYVTLTIETMKDFGVHVTEGSTKEGHPRFTIEENQYFHGNEQYPIEGDWSNGAIWLVAAAMTGQSITVTGLRPNSVQADKRILSILESAGVTCTWDSTAITVSGKAHEPIHVNLEQMPDLLPILSSLACSIEGESSFINGARLRLKESDRLEAVAQLVRDSGGTVRIEGDNLYITGTGTLMGGTVDCVNDHRLVMAGALNALIATSPMILKDSEAISKSYPHFFTDWKRLGGETHSI